MTELKRPIWTDLWDIQADTVSCKECQASQPMACRDKPFLHEAGCSREGPGQFPYIEILEVLKLMHYADQPLPDEAKTPAWLPPKD